MIIRTATANDWPALKALNEVIVYAQPDSFMHEQVQLKRVIVAEQNQTVVGYALWQNIWGNTPILSLVKVFPDYQRQGVGTKLIAEIEKRIKDEGFNHYLSSAVADNQDGKAFHQKMGFEEIGQLEMWHGGETFFKKNL